MRFLGGRATHYGRANGFAQQSEECSRKKNNKNKINGKWHPIGCTVGNVYLIRKTKMKFFIYWSAAGSFIFSEIKTASNAHFTTSLIVQNVNIKSPQMSTTSFRLSTYHNN